MRRIYAILLKCYVNVKVSILSRGKCAKINYIHLLAEIPPKMSVSYFIGYLKGKSTLMIFERHANLKYKYGNRHFWCRGYYVDMFTGEPVEKKQ